MSPNDHEDRTQTGVNRDNNQRPDVNEEVKQEHNGSQDPTVEDAMQKRRQELTDAADA